MLRPGRGISPMMVPEAAAPTITSSWGNGTRLVQLAAFDQLLPEPVRVCVVDASNVILELPKQSPTDVPMKGIPAPAAAISIKSALASEAVAAVTVTGVPGVALFTSIRFAVLLPVTVKVPLHVKVWLKIKLSVFKEDVPKRVKSWQVIGVVILTEPRPEQTKL